MLAGNQKHGSNINEQYVVEGVELTGVAESRIGKALRDDMQKLVGEKFNQAAADELAGRLRHQLSDYTVSLKVKRGDKEKQVKVVFVAERNWWRRFRNHRSAGGVSFQGGIQRRHRAAPRNAP